MDDSEIMHMQCDLIREWDGEVKQWINNYAADFRKIIESPGVHTVESVKKELYK